MTDLSLAQHSDGGARCGFTSSAISMNSAIQSRRTTRSTNYAALVIGRCGSIHSGFGSAIQTRHREAPGRARRASGCPGKPPAAAPSYGLAVGPTVEFPADTIEMPMKFVVAVVGCTTGRSAGLAPLRI